MSLSSLSVCELTMSRVSVFACAFYTLRVALLNKTVILKRKLRFPVHQISWTSEWLIEYVIFLHGLAQQRGTSQQRNLAQR